MNVESISASAGESTLGLWDDGTGNDVRNAMTDARDLWFYVGCGFHL